MKTSAIKNLYLNIGEIGVLQETGTLSCFGLGSCIGVFLYDKFMKLGAGAHIFLPGTKDSEVAGDQFKYSDHAIEELILRMLDSGSHRQLIRAKIAGGSTKSTDTYRIGERNSVAIKKLLRQHGIMIVAEDVGGKNSRSATFFVENGSLSIRTSENKCYLR